jgi:hypothetical protein
MTIGGIIMLAFVAGVVVGSFFMLFIMSMMVAAKDADRRIEFSFNQE